MMNIEETIVGIDLGTTNSVLSVLDNDKPVTLLIDNTKLLPSAVHYSNGSYIVGQTAKNIAILEPENTVLSIKRKMGQDITIKMGNKKLRPEEISAIILTKLADAFKEQYSLTNGQQIRAVITVPAYFSEEQREATKQAAELANLKVERIINEPTAAALAFGLNKLENEAFAIYDLGGGTFDVSIVENHGGIIEVLSTTGDTMLGGDDFDLLLADFIWKAFLENNSLNAVKNAKVDARLIKIAEETKIKLSSGLKVKISENFFLKHNDHTYHLQVEVSRKDFEKLILSRIEKTVDLIENAINDSKLDLSKLNGIILVGGSSRIPLVSKLIEERLNISPVLIDLPDEAVSHGATIQGAIINHIDIDTILIDITPHSLGIRVLDRDPMTELSELLLGKKLESSPFDNTFSTSFIIPKNSLLPVKRNQRFSPIVPFQKAYEIKVYQGEHKNPDKNRLIGETLLNVDAPTEEGGIDVTFELDINGIIKVSALALGTESKVSATFKSSRGMKTQQNNLVDKIVSFDDAAKNIIDKAERMLKEKDLNNEDKTELTELLEKYKNAKINREPDSSIENELLDLLYYLEQ